MPIPIFSLATRGLEAVLIKIEVDHYTSQPGVVIVGLADTAIHESRERVRSAIKNSGYHFPRGKVVVNLAPADVRKSGPCFDLAIALGMIAVAQRLSFEGLEDSLFFGELALDGSLRHVNGILSLVTFAREKKFKNVFVPEVNAREAALIGDITVYGVQNLRQLVDYLLAGVALEPTKRSDPEDFSDSPPLSVDFADVKGQGFTKRGLEIAAAGSHNIMMNGSPGSGKTMMARALQSILPPMTLSESLEVTKLYSISGLLPPHQPLIRHRPFRVVHHTASGAALVGGGRIPKPGEVSLAHRGVLFLDEFAEFPAQVLELLRQPVEDREVTISRTFGSLTYPSQFLLCAAMNPCPCGFFNIKDAKVVCHCQPSAIMRYHNRISGPLLDRIDLHCSVSPVNIDDLHRETIQESSAEVQRRVRAARDRQSDRYKTLPWLVNAEIPAKWMREFCSLTPSLEELMKRAATSLHLSARGYQKVIRVARTIADLDHRDDLQEGDLLEALQYRRNENS